MTDDLVERLARGMATKHYAQRFSRAPDELHVQINAQANWPDFSETVSLCLAEIAAAGYAVVKRGLLAEIRASRGEHDWSERGYWYADEQMDKQLEEALAASRKP